MIDIVNNPQYIPYAAIALVIIIGWIALLVGRKVK